jgi:hypothetical protein
MLQLGPGVFWYRELDETLSIELHGDVQGGYLVVDESHLLRNDLGPIRHGGTWNHIPFVGAKQSGIGSELGGVRALDEYTQLKIVNVTR